MVSGPHSVPVHVPYLMHLLFHYSYEATRDPGEAGLDKDPRPELVRAAGLRHLRGRSVRGTDVAHLQPQVMRVDRTCLYT